VPSLPVVIIARFFTGILSAIPTIVVAGSIEDVFNMKARVWMIFTWAVIGNIAVCVGPIFSTYVTANIGWSVNHFGFPFFKELGIADLSPGAGYSTSPASGLAFSSYFAYCSRRADPVSCSNEKWPLSARPGPT